MIERLIDNMPDGLTAQDPAADIHYATQVTPQEAWLYLALDEIVEGIPFEEVARLPAGRDRLPRNLGAYGLAPFVSNHPNRYSTRDSAATAYSWPRGVYQPDPYNLPYLDASLGIGLVFNGRLAAISAAGVERDYFPGRIEIAQLQGLVAVGKEVCVSERERRQRYRDSGLHGGFLWRDTLVQAWIEVAKATGSDTVSIVSAENNGYSKPHNMDRFREGYNKVAERMGFERDTPYGNWVRSL